VGEEFREPQIQLEALSPVPFVVVVSTRHALANRDDRQGPVDPAELADHVQIVQEDATAQTAGKDFGVLSPGTWRVAGQDIKHVLIREGLGWGRLPLWAVEEDLLEGRLRQLDVAA